jgi:hypothetical protein
MQGPTVKQQGAAPPANPEGMVEDYLAGAMVNVVQTRALAQMEAPPWKIARFALPVRM